MAPKQRRDGNAVMFSSKTAKSAMKKKNREKTLLYRGLQRGEKVGEVMSKVKIVDENILKLEEKEKDIEEKMKALKEEKKSVKQDRTSAQAEKRGLEEDLKTAKKEAAKKKREENKNNQVKIKFSFNK